MWIPRGEADAFEGGGKAKYGPGGVLADEVLRDRGIAFASRRCAPNQKGCRDVTNQTVDGEFTNRTNPNKPLYKPEYWDKVQQLDYDTNNTDPMLRCFPLGVPRMGPPTKIVQTSKSLIFLTASYPMSLDVRDIAIDGRGHDPERAGDISFDGDAVGRWDGDTLVVDSVGFNDITWIDSGKGFFHSDKMHVIERLRREGNKLHYQVTIEDPDVLMQPWAKDPQVLTLSNDPYAPLPESEICRDNDLGVAVLRLRH
jgi:hypothetical protein